MYCNESISSSQIFRIISIYKIEDAYSVGIDKYAKVVDNGDGLLGTVLNRTNPYFRNVYKKADVVIAKGQANYECLSEEYKNIYFLADDQMRCNCK